MPLLPSSPSVFAYQNFGCLATEYIRYYPVRACAAGGRVFGVSVCLFVCLSTVFLACSGITGLLELLFSFLQMALLNKLAFLSSTYESDHLEAQKKLLF